MKRILSSCLLGVVLASSVLAKPASAQFQGNYSDHERREWREQQLERDRQHRLDEQRERQHRLELERQRQHRLEEQRERQRRLELERQHRLEEQRNHRDRY